MSPDPYDGSYDSGDPQSLNRYSYVLNNPLTATDPSGLDTITQITIVNVNGSDSWGDGSGIPFIGYQKFAWYVVPGNAPNNSTPSNRRNCTPSPASAGQYVLSSAAVAGMLTEFVSGVGAQDRTFGPDSSVSAVMGQSDGVQSVLNNYYMTGQTSGLYSFGGVGYARAGANPVAQFVGSFRYSISPGAGGINLSLTNTTSFRSLIFDVGPQWGRHTQYQRAGVPMGNTHQIYNIFVSCKVG